MTQATPARSTAPTAARPSKRTILVVDDVELNRELVEFQLQGEFDILKASDGREALELLEQRYADISLMLLDLVMPTMTGEELLVRMQGNPLLSSVPVVVMTSEDSQEMETRCLELGASDFIRKPFEPTILHHRVRGLIRLHEADSALAAIERDSVTGLYNREAFLLYANAFREEHRGEPITAVLAVIADFEHLDELFGETTVKEHLRYVGKEMLAPGNATLPAYLGEGRFASLNVHSDHMSIPWLLGEVERSTKEAPIPSARVKFGVYKNVPLERELPQVYRTISTKMAGIKDSYIDDIVVFGAEEEERITRRRTLVGDVEASLANGDFHVVYQPKHCASTGKLCGAEALVRWNHPTLGPVSPGEFIPIFEENGFINQLDSFVHVRVYRTMRAWLESGLPAVPVSSNFSRRDLLDNSYISYLVGIRRSRPNEVPPHLLRAELTESMLTENYEQLHENMRRLNEVGYAIELDDFGAGYSNLAALAELPLDTVKLDMSLVRTLDTKEPVVRHCIELAHDLGLTVVAEGVETQEQLDKLRALGCDKIQGYYFSRPLPADEFVAYLKDHAARGMIA
ncbi:MAG: EAL domain-containing protein [Coriobacteriales bacterium]